MIQVVSNSIKLIKNKLCIIFILLDELRNNSIQKKYSNPIYK